MASQVESASKNDTKMKAGHQIEVSLPPGQGRRVPLDAPYMYLPLLFARAHAL